MKTRLDLLKEDLEKSGELVARLRVLSERVAKQYGSDDPDYTTDVDFLWFAAQQAANIIEDARRVLGEVI